MNDLTHVVKIISSSQNVLLTSHINPDGDSIASMLALYYIMTGLGKKCEIILASEPPKIYDFLENFKHIKKLDLDDTRKYTFDLAIVVDCGDYGRVQNVKHLINDTFILNIDHHPANPRFGNYNYVDCERSSSAEIIFYLAKKMSFNISQSLAESIYVGIMTDTGSFRYSNTAMATFKTAAELLKYGANPAYLSAMIYERNSLRKIKLLETILRRMKFFYENQVVISYLYQADIDAAGAEKSDMEGLIDFLRSIDTVKIGVLLVRCDDLFTKLSFRSKGEINVMLLAKSFGGGGHRNAAGSKVFKSLKTTQKMVLDRIEEYL